jgi:hypothetical protein
VIKIFLENIPFSAFVNRYLVPISHNRHDNLTPRVAMHRLCRLTRQFSTWYQRAKAQEDAQLKYYSAGWKHGSTQRKQNQPVAHNPR